MMSLWADGLLVLSLWLVALAALGSADLLRAAMLFILFGLLLTLAWARLQAPDIALAEAVIGTGVTGVLLLDVVGRIQGKELKRVE